MNPDLFTSIKPINTPLHISTNAVTKTTNLKCDVKNCIDVQYDPTQMATIFVQSKLSDKHHITYDKCKEDSFLETPTMEL